MSAPELVASADDALIALDHDRGTDDRLDGEYRDDYRSASG